MSYLRNSNIIMKQRIIYAMLVVSCAISVHAAQNDWENENVIQINREPARAYFMPYAATPGDRHLSLNGTWQFRWAPTPEACQLFESNCKSR